MAEEKFKINDAGVDTSALADSLKETVPKVSESYENDVELSSMERVSDRSNLSYSTSEAVGATGYNSQNTTQQRSSQLSSNQSNMNRSHHSELEKKDNLEKKENEEKHEEKHQQPVSAPTSEGVGKRNNTAGEKVGSGYQGDSIPKSNELAEGKKESPSLGAGEDGLNNNNIQGNKAGNLPTNNQGINKDEGQNKSPEDEKKEEKERANDNNANNIKNLAEVGKASGNPYAMAAGAAVDAADKVTGGKSTEMLGKAMTRANQIAPGGRTVQNASNRLSESGVSNKVGQAAAMKNGGSGAASKGADTASKAKKASTGKKTPAKKGLPRKNNNPTERDANKNERGSAGMSMLTNAVKNFFLRHPFVLIVLVLILLLFLLLLTSEDFTGSSGNHKYCSYDLSGVTTTGSVKLNNVQVELINCDGTASNYTVLETIDFEKYVLGVALAEIGESSPDEGIKAQIIAARNFALTRNSGMCPNNPDNCFYGYNVETGKIRMRACEADQVYWDYEKDIYRQDRGSISLYSPEINSGTIWKHALSEERKTQVLALANEVKGKVLLDESGNVMPTSYKSSDQVSMLEDAKAGKSYQEILEHKYGSSKFNSATCSNYGTIDYGNYELNSEGDTILNERLDKFLESKGTSLEEFNSLIESNVKKNGYGTRAGVVAAAVSLIAELGNNYDVKVPYFLSGGHHDGVKQGAVGYWGSGVEDDGRRCYYTGYGNIYTVCGLDCSGFVPWAIKNGGFQVGVRLAGDFQSMDGAKRVSLSSSNAVLEPGDLLESEGHIVLVVGVDESSNQYICAEASGKNTGVLFTRRPFTGGSGYWGVKMDGYYDKYSLAGK